LVCSVQVNEREKRLILETGRKGFNWERGCFVPTKSDILRQMGGAGRSTKEGKGKMVKEEKR